MDQPHRPQRSVRKDPFPQIPFAIEDAAPSSGKTVIWVCVALAAFTLLLAWLV